MTKEEKLAKKAEAKASRDAKKAELVNKIETFKNGKACRWMERVGLFGAGVGTGIVAGKVIKNAHDKHIQKEAQEVWDAVAADIAAEEQAFNEGSEVNTTEEIK